MVQGQNLLISLVSLNIFQSSAFAFHTLSVSDIDRAVLSFLF